MSDRELLELAAKAAGYEIGAWFDDGYQRGFLGGRFNRSVWNSLTDDGDALRLSGDASIDVCHAPALKECHAQFYLAGHVLSKRVAESWGSDKRAAIRRAITRAAAEIGKTMA